MKYLPAVILAVIWPAQLLAEATPQGGPLDIRIRHAITMKTRSFASRPICGIQPRSISGRASGSRR